MMNFRNETILILFIVTSFFTISVLFYADDIPPDIYFMLYVMPIIVITVLSYSLAKKYNEIKNICLGYTALFFSMLFLIGAEISWIVMPYLGLQQYVGIPDVFYSISTIILIFHPLMILHHYLKHRIETKYIIFFIGIVSVGILIYIIGSIDTIKFPEQFYTGLWFSILVSVLLASTIITMFNLKFGKFRLKIFSVWIIMAIAISMNAIGDLWYYIGENYNEWHQGDLENIVWYIGYVLIIYALLVQKSKWETV